MRMLSGLRWNHVMAIDKLHRPKIHPLAPIWEEGRPNIQTKRPVTIIKILLLI